MQDAAEQPEEAENGDLTGSVGDESVEAQVEQLLQRGGEAYQLGDFDLAIESFEAAYKLTPEAPLLYNLALSHLRRHEASQDLDDLHRAKALLTNFNIALGIDPSLGDPENVAQLLGQIDDEIVTHEAREAEEEEARQAAELQRQREAELQDDPACTEVTPDPYARPPERDRRLGGLLMGAGGAALAAGVASIAGFSAKGREFSTELELLEAERSAIGCESTFAPTSCPSYDEAIAATVTNGRRANIFAGTIGGTLTALGAAGLVAGAVVFAKSGGRGSQRAQLHLAPSLTGLVLSGEF